MDFLTVEPARCTVSEIAPAALPDAGFVWVDCDYADTRAWVDPVARLTGVRVLDDHLADAENEAHPSYFDSTLRYEMIVFRALAFRPPADATRMFRIRTRPTVFFLFPQCLVTLRSAESVLFPTARRRLLTAAEHGQRLPTRPEDMMLRLLNGMVDRYLELRVPLTEQLESWQRQLLHPRKPFHDWSLLLDARMELRKLESLCEEQLDALQEWRDGRLESTAAEAAGRRDAAGGPGTLGGLSEVLEVRANDVMEHIRRVLQHTRRLESSVETAVQLHFSATAHRTNDIMRTLTVITAVFMPLNLITGIFGMNFDFIPGLHSRVAFWIALGAMAVVALALFAWFRSRRFLSTSPTPAARRPASAPHPADRPTSHPADQPTSHPADRAASR